MSASWVSQTLAEPLSVDAVEIEGVEVVEASPLDLGQVLIIISGLAAVVLDEVLAVLLDAGRDRLIGSPPRLTITRSNLSKSFRPPWSGVKDKLRLYSRAPPLKLRSSLYFAAAPALVSTVRNPRRKSPENLL